MTEISDGQKREIHLCEDCAGKKGFPVQPNFTVAEVLGSLLDAQKHEEDEGPEITCPVCGITFSEFRSKGRFGCPNDYVVFKERLDTLLEKVHGSTQHIGKTPPRMDTSIARQRELMVLREKLDRLIKKEAYEEAAKIRDKIKTIEEQLHGEHGE